MKLEAVLAVLRSVAPEHLAEDWDQAGLHLAGDLGANKPVRKALLCIDLTPAVLAEAIEKKCRLIVAYHPPIFHPLKRLADRDWKEQMLAEAVRHGIAVYSPHTALDAVRQGMNDWLCEGLGTTATRWSIVPPGHRQSPYCKIVVYVPRECSEDLRKAMAEAGCGYIGNYSHCSFNLDGLGTFKGDPGTNPAIGSPGHLETVEETRVEMICRKNIAGEALRSIRAAHPYEEPAIDVFALMEGTPPEDEWQTPGRIAWLKQPTSAETLIRRVKKTLGLKKLKAAIPPDYGTPHDQPDGFLPGKLLKIAVCVGAGGSLFEKPLADADAYITGEMQHHQVLDLYLKGKVVILAGHTNTERPFLRNYRGRIIEQGGGKVDWLISEQDRAPMQIM
jgi:dinuclear metal center YbgI/SA1388 family protein